MIYRYFTKTDGMRIYLRESDIISYEEMEDHTLVTTIMEDYEVINTIEEIFNGKPKFSNN